MFITVAVSEEKECLFNPDCMINVLLAAIKKRSNIPKSEMIDLCSADGICKYLFKDLESNGKKYFDKREFCHVVIVRPITNGEEETDREKYEFCPVLQRLQDDYHFMIKLNATDIEKSSFSIDAKRFSSSGSPEKRHSTYYTSGKKRSKAAVRFKSGHKMT